MKRKAFRSLTSFFVFFFKRNKTPLRVATARVAEIRKKNWNQNIVLMQSGDNYDRNGLRRSGESVEGKQSEMTKRKKNENSKL